ncbi:hypothetical protein C4573_02385 [Candidatus Woesearchaeota archaeon]|nr:MAG: hypothetical protein C4573_02385 [Candidatus Woesearchaeota archaeon]
MNEFSKNSYRDILEDHKREEENYFPTQLEKTLQQVYQKSAREIHDAIKQDILSYGKQEDDITFVVIKKS